MTLRDMEIDLDNAENAGRKDPVWWKPILIAIIVAVLTFLRCENGK